MSVASERQSGTLLRQFASEVKFLNESYYMCLLVMMVVTDVVRVPVDVKAMVTGMFIRKKRTWHLFETGLSSGAEETSRF